MSKDAVVDIEGKHLKLSNLDKILYPAAGFTKGQVIDYYVCIAPVFSQPTGIKTKVLTYLALGKTTVATPAALVGLDDSIRKFVIECSSDDFPSVLLDQLTRIPDSTSDLLVSSKVQSLYGTQAVGMAYYREIIKPFGVSLGIMQDASERSDEVP